MLFGPRRSIKQQQNNLCNYFGQRRGLASGFLHRHNAASAVRAGAFGRGITYQLEIPMELSGVGAIPPVPVTTDANLQLSVAQFLGNLFDQISNVDDNQVDTNDPVNPHNPTSITQTQFGDAFNSLALPPQLRGLGANTVFSLLDPNQTGSVSRSDFVTGLTRLLEDVRSGRAIHHAHVATTPAEASDDDTQPSAWQLISQVLGSQPPAANNAVANDAEATQSATDDAQRRSRLSL
jgi:hypothetical protein